MKDEILGRAFNFFGANPIKDDITVVVLEVSKKWCPEVSSGSSGEKEVHQVPPVPLFVHKQHVPEIPILFEATSVAPDMQNTRPLPIAATAPDAFQAAHEQSAMKSTKMQKIRIKSPFSA